MYKLWCQRCCWKTHPTILTAYTLPGACDRCGRSTMLAIVKPAAA